MTDFILYCCRVFLILSPSTVRGRFSELDRSSPHDMFLVYAF